MFIDVGIVLLVLVLGVVRGVSHDQQEWKAKKKRQP